MGRESCCADAKSAGSGAGRGSGSLGSCPSLAPRSLPLLLQSVLPAGRCAEKTPWVFQRGSGELWQSERGLGKGTVRWQCHPAVAMSASAAELPPHRRCGSTCGRLRELSAALGLSRERRVYSLELSIHHLPEASPLEAFSTFPPPPPLCQLSQMCSALEAAKFPVLGKGNHSIS